MNTGDIPTALARQVRERAANRCEYCGLAQLGQEATFHVDHVHPRRESGATVLENLALACVSCSLRKGARIAFTDPETGVIVNLFNPRTHVWRDHFVVTADFVITGRTPAARATVVCLLLNRPMAVEIRREEALRGRYSR